MSRHVTNMTIDDVEHYTPEERADIIAAYLPHERKARARGIPAMGSGQVFPIEEDRIKCEPVVIAREWAQIGGMDFGWDHPFAAVKLAWDRDSDIVYVCQSYQAKNETPIIQAAALRPWGAKLVWAWPADGLQTEKGSGVALAAQYREQGLVLLNEHATYEAGGFKVEPGIMDMLDRMQTGRLKVASHLNDWFFEFRLYHRKEGKIVAIRDDLMSATRYGIMMLRKAKSQAEMEYVAPEIEVYSDMPR